MELLIGDGSEMPNNRCSKCITYDVDCTYDVVNVRYCSSLAVVALSITYSLLSRNDRLPRGKTRMSYRVTRDSSYEHPEMSLQKLSDRLQLC